MIVLKHAGAARFKIQTDEWLLYAVKYNIENPFERLYKQYNQIEEEEMINGKKHTTWRLVPNPDAPPVPTEQEKADYRFEQEKFTIRRLIEEGYYDDIAWDIEHCYPGNRERLLEYVKSLRACEKTGQCSMFCTYYGGKNGNCR